MAAIRMLAIIGFIVTVIFAAWLAVQVVRVLPAAFSMLASLADRTERPREIAFTASPDERIVRSGDTVTISWTRMPERGVYTFTYHCADATGISARARVGDDSFDAFCDEELTLPADDALHLTIFSDELPSADITYTVRFMPESGSMRDAGGRISVTNPDAGESEREESEYERDTDTETGTPPTYYRTVPVVTTTYPVSDPQGYVDLQASFIAVGTYDTYTNTFIPRASLREGDRSAIRFEVKNIGTKTSTGWHFTAELPTSPSYTYVAPTQAALRPNERQVITLQFDATGFGQTTARVSVTGGADSRTGNNTFSERIDVR